MTKKQSSMTDQRLEVMIGVSTIGDDEEREVCSFDEFTESEKSIVESLQEGIHFASHRPSSSESDQAKMVIMSWSLCR
jgi:hypothetical protein